MPELKEYIRYNYKTNEDLIRDEEKKHQKQVQFWTRVTAITAIIAVLVSTIIQVIFSSKERDVQIKNKNAFPDSTKVYLSNPYLTYDTIKIYDTVKIKQK